MIIDQLFLIFYFSPISKIISYLVIIFLSPLPFFYICILSLFARIFFFALPCFFQLIVGRLKIHHQRVPFVCFSPPPDKNNIQQAISLSLHWYLLLFFYLACSRISRRLLFFQSPLLIPDSSISGI